MSESRTEPANPLTAPSKTRGTWEDEDGEDKPPSWEPGGGSRNIQPKNTKPGKQQRQRGKERGKQEACDGWEMGTTTAEVVLKV